MGEPPFEEVERKPIPKFTTDVPGDVKEFINSIADPEDVQEYRAVLLEIDRVVSQLKSAAALVEKMRGYYLNKHDARLNKEPTLQELNAVAKKANRVEDARRNRLLENLERMSSTMNLGKRDVRSPMFQIGDSK